MPQYFFHLDCDDYQISDREGIELLSLAAAEEHARQTASEIANCCANAPMNRSIIVADAMKCELLRVSITFSVADGYPSLSTKRRPPP